LRAEKKVIGQLTTGLRVFAFVMSTPRGAAQNKQKREILDTGVNTLQKKKWIYWLLCRQFADFLSSMCYLRLCHRGKNVVLSIFGQALVIRMSEVILESTDSILD
jgi:hypothetical protein